MSLIMIMSCLAGCLSTEDVSDEDGAESLGKVVASTYHVEQLLKAVAGDTLEVELLSPTNVPVHDFEPSASDILKLQDADVFFYHGLGLEPWVEPTLDSLSLAAPTSVSTHAMPTGETTLDYESILISELCELAEGPFERTNLSMNEISMHDIHAEHVTHSMWFPEMDHEHDDNGHGDDHDDHDDDHDDENGDHDDHSGHGHASPMDTITNPSGCPTDYVIVIYELEKGDVVIEFEAEDDHNFNLTVLKMGGGHHHHAHDDHDDHVDEDRDREEHEGHDDHDEHDEITEEDCERRNGTWEEDPDHIG
ncbi:MAG: zinc ABC transporter substrate-binding protein, partial [Candidatus Thalassarchaeaceae archaeon]|nr:zinc ABC transporter substrate-binding protein [Candidatus Thalassarchaeaceae archaeon]